VSVCLNLYYYHENDHFLSFLFSLSILINCYCFFSINFIKFYFLLLNLDFLLLKSHYDVLNFIFSCWLFIVFALINLSNFIDRFSVFRLMVALHICFYFYFYFYHIYSVIVIVIVIDQNSSVYIFKVIIFEFLSIVFKFHNWTLL
jgi:hypothetical protein